jgi:DNA-binding MarR family transcriptional regulator
MLYVRLTPAGRAAVQQMHRDTLAASRARRAKFLAERELRAELRAHFWSESAVGELVKAHRALQHRGVL